MSFRPTGHDCPDCGSQMRSNDQVCGVDDAVRVICPICGAVFRGERTDDGFFVTDRLVDGDPCPHDDTMMTEGNGRWIGEEFVRDRVEMCRDCGVVLSIT